MNKSIIHELYTKVGESIWLDNLGRSLIDSGRLKDLIEVGVRGVTTNPTIFDKAIRGSSDYDEYIHQLVSKGLTPSQIYDELTVRDVRDAAEILLPVYTDSRGRDGYVSLEVSPRLAFDREKTVEEAKRLNSKVGYNNVMFKVPATPQGLEAVEELIGEGINVNVTLIFSQQQYIDTVHAYMRGVERMLSRGADVSKVFSVASVFVSRVDTMVDSMLDELITVSPDASHRESLTSLKGKAAVANARIIYRHYREIFLGEEFAELKSKGAGVQKLLWGSTSTKNPSYSDVKYVEELIGKDTINTIPEKTIFAFLDHGRIIEPDYNFTESEKVLELLKEKDINIDQVCSLLMEDGLKAFVKSFESLINSIESKISSRASVKRDNL